MVLTALPVLLVFCLCLILFHRTCLRGHRWSLSDRQWAGVDYLWYGAGFIALLIGGFQVLAALDRSDLAQKEELIQQQYFQIESLVSESTGPEDGLRDEDHQLWLDIGAAIRETRFTTGWPLAPIRFQGRTFRSLNHFISVRAEELGVSQLSMGIMGPSTSILDRVGEARMIERRMKQRAPPLWLIVTMPYVFAAVIALRVTKVTFQIRREARTD